MRTPATVGVCVTWIACLALSACSNSPQAIEPTKETNIVVTVPESVRAQTPAKPAPEPVDSSNANANVTIADASGTTPATFERKRMFGTRRATLSPASSARATQAGANARVESMGGASDPAGRRATPSAPTNAPASAPTSAPSQWWLAAPDPVPGQVRVVAKGQGPTLMAARQAAVVQGRASLTELRGAPPADTTFEKSQAFKLPGGTYEAYVLISCER